MPLMKPYHKQYNKHFGEVQQRMSSVAYVAKRSVKRTQLQLLNILLDNRSGMWECHSAFHSFVNNAGIDASMARMRDPLDKVKNLMGLNEQSIFEGLPGNAHDLVHTPLTNGELHPWKADNLVRVAIRTRKRELKNPNEVVDFLKSEPKDQTEVKQPQEWLRKEV